MIISRTPFRISFLGGGTDLPSFYENEPNGDFGAVVSTSINKYMYLTVNDRFDSSYRISYSKTEIKFSIEEIEHPIVRKVLEKYVSKGKGLEIISMADIPAGTGLGSSSSFTVGLLHGLKAHLGIFQSAEALASEASHIEIVDLKEPIGKQDQYAAAYGGLQYIRFHPNGDVSVDPIICSKETRQNLESGMMMFYTGVTRSASKILSEQKANTVSKQQTLRGMRDLATKFKTALEAGATIGEMGEILHEGWILKKSMASGISDPQIDEWYNKAMRAGACGGKILGAGGGGFLMMLCPPEKQASLRAELSELRYIPVEFENQGSKIIFVG